MTGYAPSFGPRGTRATVAWRARLGLVLAFLLAFCWQTSVTQAHFHLARAETPTTIVVTPGAAAARSVPAKPDTPDTCPLCRELIHAAHVLPGSPPLLAPPAIVQPLGPAPVAALASTVQRPFLAWYSRGPPATFPVR